VRNVADHFAQVDTETTLVAQQRHSRGVEGEPEDGRPRQESMDQERERAITIWRSRPPCEYRGLHKQTSATHPATPT